MEFKKQRIGKRISPITHIYILNNTLDIVHVLFQNIHNPLFLKLEAEGGITILQTENGLDYQEELGAANTPQKSGGKMDKIQVIYLGNFWYCFAQL